MAIFDVRDAFRGVSGAGWGPFQYAGWVSSEAADTQLVSAITGFDRFASNNHVFSVLDALGVANRYGFGLANSLDVGVRVTSVDEAFHAAHVSRFDISNEAVSHSWHQIAGKVLDTSGVSALGSRLTVPASELLDTLLTGHGAGSTPDIGSHSAVAETSPATTANEGDTSIGTIGANFTIAANGWGGDAFALTNANFSAAGLDVSDGNWGKLQYGLAEIYLEAQMSVASLSGAARDAALADFVSTISGARIYEGGYVAIDAVASNGDGAALLAQLEALGMQRGASFGAMAGGLIPIDMLDEVSNLGLLNFASPVRAETNAGAVQSQDVAAINVDYLHNSYGLTGAGVTIGFLSDSFNTATLTTSNTALAIHYAQDIASGDLPNNVNILADASGSVRDEGRAMAQLAWDIAPGASLAFHTAFISQADFAQGIIDLYNAGARVIVDDVRYYEEPMFQDGVIAQAVQAVTAGGAMYFSSAGNQGTSSYESVYRPSDTTINITGSPAVAGVYRFHDFDPGAGQDFVQSFTKTGTGAATYVLNWDNASAAAGGLGATADLAIIIFNAAGTPIAAFSSNNIGANAIEVAQNASTAWAGFAIGVREGTGFAAPTFVKTVISGSVTINEWNTNSGTSFGHSNAENANAIGAVDWVDSGRFAAPYIAGEPMPYLETFSSSGDIPILFDTAGNRYAAPVYRSTVDFSAADGGNNTFFGSDNPNSGAYAGFEADTSPNFYGTSAAAPNAAAVAALLKSAFPTATNEQILLALRQSAVDVQVTYTGTQIGDGYDNRSGYGMIKADVAYTKLAAMLNAASTITPGELAIVGYNTGQHDTTGNADTVDALRFVALTDMPAGTVLYFTDRAWTGTAFTSDANDGTATYTVPGGGLAAGTTVSLTGAALGTLNLEEAGDTIYAYTGTADAPQQFLFAIEIGDGNTTFNGSLAGTGLINGVSAVAVGLDSGSYHGPTTEDGAHLFNGAHLVWNIADTNNWVGGDRNTSGNINAFDQADDTNFLVSPDLAIVAGGSQGGGSGGSGGIFTASVDANVSGGTAAFNINQLYAYLDVSGNHLFYQIQDVVIDTVHGKVFIADSDINGGHNRVLQLNLSDLTGNPGVAPAVTVLYSDTGTTTASRIFNLVVDKDNGIVYFDHGQTLAKVNYNTPGQAAVTLATLGGTGSGNPAGTTNSGFVDDFVIDFATGTLYFSAHRVVVAQDGDAVSRNYIGKIVGVDPTDGAGAYAWGGAITQLPFTPDDAASGTLFNSGEQFPQELGTVEGIALSPDGLVLYIVTARTLYDNDGDGGFSGPGGFGTPPVLTPGGIYSYALTGNATGIYNTVYQPTDDGNDGSQAITANGPQGLLDDIEVDSATGRLYFTDMSGDQIGPSSNPPGDEGVWAINPNGTGLSFVAALNNVGGVIPSSLFLNRAPTIAAIGTSTGATEATNAPGSGATTNIALLSGITLGDTDTPDSGDELAGAVVRVSGNFQAGADTLRLSGNTSGTTASGILYSYNATLGVMVLTGAATAAEYAAALAQVSFATSGDNPTAYGAATTRTISVAVSDGMLFSDAKTVTLNVTGINDAPVNTVGGTHAATEDANSIITGLSVFDVDADPATQDITVTLHVDHGTIAIFTNIGNGLEVADVSGNGTDTVTITATQNQINATFAAANGVTYRPAANWNGGDVLTMTSNDGGLNGNDPGLTGTGTSEQDQDTKTITVVAANDAPIVAGDGTESTITILEDTPSAAGQTVASLLSGQYSDATDNLFNAGGNPNGSSPGAFSGIAVVANAATAGTGNWQYFDGSGWVNIPTTASSTVATLIGVNTAIRFAPATDFNGTEPALTVRLVDNSLGFSITDGQTVNISGVNGSGGTTAYSGASVVIGGSVTAVNDAPAFANLDGDSVTYVEGAQTYLPVDAGTAATIADVDSANFNGGSLTIALTAGAQTEDQILLLSNGNITFQGTGEVIYGGNQIGTYALSVDFHTLTVSFTSDNATPAAAQEVVRAVNYYNSAGDAPTGGPRTVTYTLVDGDGTANTGVDTVTATSTIDVAPVNSAPSGTNFAAAVLEDGAYTFAQSSFGYSDGSEGDAFAGVVITTLPADGTLFLNGVAITVPGTFISAADIAASMLTFAPAANASGNGYGSFTFQVRDDGGIANGGQDTDQSPNTFEFNVTAVNDAPTSTNLSGDAATYVAGASSVLLDVGGNASFADLDSTDFSGGQLTVSIANGAVAAEDQLVIDTSGTVSVAGNAVSVGGVQIATFTGGGAGGGAFTFFLDPDATPAAVQALVQAIGYTNSDAISPTGGIRTIGWTLVDGDGTANGGNDTLAFTSTVEVIRTNNAPEGADATFTINEDATYTFTAASFGYSDIDGDDFAGVVITTLPAPGTLYYDADGDGGSAAVAVTAGTFISASDVALGLLTYRPVADANGVPYSSFTFQVRDDGGTANGGVDADQSPNTITFDVTALNDAPTLLAPGLQTIDEDGSIVLSTGNGNTISVADVDATTLTVTLSAAHGTLTIASTAGLSFGTGDGTGDATMTFSGTAAAINAALGTGLTYNPAADFNGSDALSIGVTDNGETGTGAVGTASTSVGISLTAINDAPVVSGDGTEVAAQVTEDVAGAGQTVQALFAGQYSDAADNQVPGGGASSPGAFSGIAVTGNGSSDATGQWQYFSGGVWTDIGAASDGAAKLLGDPFVTLIRFNPAQDYNGPAPSLTVHLIDNSLGFGIVNGMVVDLSGGGAIGGSTAYSAGTVVLSQPDIIAVNDAPVNTLPGTQVINEDGGFTLSTGSGNAIQVADVDATTLTVTLSVAHGALTIGNTAGLSFATGDGTSDTTMTFTGTAAAINAALGDGLMYSLEPNYHGTDAISISTSDGGQSGTGGTQSDADSVAITINSVNDAPSGTDATVTASEDDPYVFVLADFGFSDPVEGDGFNAVSIQTFPGQGTLFLDVDGPGGAAPIDLSGVGAGVFVSAADIAAGRLYFQPDADDYGAGYASFTFKVQDDGGLANGGVDRDPTANTITIDVTADNFVPQATSLGTPETYVEDTQMRLATIMVTDTDPGDTITATLTLSDLAAGTLTTGTSGAVTSTFMGGVWTASGSVADVNKLLLKVRFDPADDFNGNFSIATSITDGVSAPVTGTKAFTGTPVNDAPAGADSALGVSRGERHVVTAAEFGFSDTVDGDAFDGVTITSLPTAGRLFFDGLKLTASSNLVISAADIAAGKLTYQPALGGDGAPTASFTFKVHDDGGTANGGVDTDPAANTVTYNVVNRAPTGSDGSVAVTLGNIHVMTLAEFGFADADGNAFASVTIDTLPAAGRLFFNGVKFVAGTVITAADIAAGKLSYNPGSNPGDPAQRSFTFQVHDDGGTAFGGTDTDATANTLTFDTPAAARITHETSRGAFVLGDDAILPGHGLAEYGKAGSAAFHLFEGQNGTTTHADIFAEMLGGALDHHDLGSLADAMIWDGGLPSVALGHDMDPALIAQPDLLHVSLTTERNWISDHLL